MTALCEESVATIFGETPTGGSGTYTYQWQKNDEGNCGRGEFRDIPGATGMHYVIPETDKGEACYLRIVYTDGCTKGELSNPVNFRANDIKKPEALKVRKTDPITCTLPNGSITITSPKPYPGFIYILNKDGVEIKNTTGIFLGLAPGTYIASVQYQEGCISPKATVILSSPLTPPAPEIEVTKLPTCDDEFGTIEVKAPVGSIYTYSLDGGTYQGSSTFSGVAAGTHSVTVRNGAGCISEAGSVLVSAPPAAPSGLITPATATICNGGAQLLTASGGTNYQWQKDGQVIAGATASTYNAITAGTYSVIISNVSCSAPASNTSIITTAAAPNLVVNNPNPICTGNSYNLRSASLTAGSSSNLVYSYWTDVNATAALSNPESVGAGIYYIKATNVGGCFTIKPVEIKLNPSAIGSITPAVAPLNCSGTPVTLTASNSISYQWYKNDTLITGATERTYRATTEGNYYVMLNNGNCTGRSANHVNVQFQECIPVAQPDAFVPTAFTPNGNNANDVLKPVLYSIRELKYFKVFNRWGQMVYQTNIIGEGWSGTVKGVQQPTETYTWVLECIDVDGNLIRKSGRSILIR